MSITRRTIKRLEEEMEMLNSDRKLPIAICTEQDGLFYYGNKTYKTIEELRDKEGIRDGKPIIIID